MDLKLNPPAPCPCCLLLWYFVHKKYKLWMNFSGLQMFWSLKNVWNLNQQNRLFESFANNWSTMQKTRPQQKFSLSIRNSLSFQFFLLAKGFNELHNWQGSSIMEWETEVVSPIYFSHHSCYFNSTRALITQQMTLKTQLGFFCVNSLC